MWLWGVLVLMIIALVASRKSLLPKRGDDNGIDSLSLVRLVAALERAAEQQFGRRVVLADERAMSMRRSPFRTVATLAELLQERLGGPHA